MKLPSQKIRIKDAKKKQRDEEIKIMSNSITIEDFYKLFQSSERQRQETERILRESFQRSQEEAERRAAEAERRGAEIDRRFAELAEENKRRETEAASRAEEIDRRFAELAEEDKRRRAEEEARRAEEDKRRRAEEDKRRRAEEDKRRRAEEDKRRRAEEAARRAEEDKRRRAEEAVRRAEEDKRRRAEEEARRAEAERRAAELDRIFAELAEENKRGMQELRKVAANTSREVGKLTSRWAPFVKDYVEPGVVRIFQERGIAVKETHPRIQAERENVAMEIDILAVDDNVAVAIEVKSRLSTTDVNEFKEKLGKFKEAFPAYKNYKIHGAVAAIGVTKEVARYAYRQGLFVIVQSGETVEIANDEAFQPKNW